METQTFNPGQQNQSSSAQDFFLYLVTFLSLSFVAFGEGSVLFGFINKFVTDSGSNAFPTFDQGAVKFGIAALIIAGPIFFIISRIIVKRINQQKIALESKVRKWLTYIVLFFTAATIIGDLITLVVNFLGGDFTSSFLLKVLVVLLIAGGIFGYYFWDMRRTEVSSGINAIAMYACIAVVATTFIAGFFIIDSPTVSRQKNIDQQRVNDIQSVDSSVRSYFNQSGKLPNSLNDLMQTGFAPFLQKEGSVTYEILNENTYKLCAEFVRSDISDEKLSREPFLKEWRHEAGRVCFDRIALKSEVLSVPVKQ